MGLGVAYERAGRLEGSAVAFREAVRLDPRDATAQFNLGLAAQKLGRHEEAIEGLSRAVALKPDFADAYLWLGESYEYKGDFDKAVEALKQAARYKPEDARTLSAHGHAYLKAGKYEEALEPFRRGARLRHDDPESLFVLGNTYMMAGRYDEAVAAFDEALRVKPDHALAQERRQVATARKHLSPQLEGYRQEAAARPKSAEARVKFAHALYALGRFAEAEPEYQAAIALNPNNADLYNLLAINYSEWGKAEKAAAAYERAAAIKPHHVLYYSLGNASQKRGRLDEALEAYRKAIEIKPTFTHALYEQGGSTSGGGTMRPPSRVSGRFYRPIRTTSSPSTRSGWPTSRWGTRLPPCSSTTSSRI